MASAVPRGYVGLVVADTRRAAAWEEGLRRAGFDVLRVEATGAAADKGDWQVAVAERDAAAARRFASEVARGERSLPRPILLSRSGWLALIAIAAILAIVVGGALLTRG